MDECENGCDGFGPLWTCSGCTGVIAVNDGTFADGWSNGTLSAEEAAARVGDFLMREIEMAAVAGWGCSSEPAHLEGFMRRSLWMHLPGNPWRNEAYARDAIATPGDGSINAHLARTVLEK